MKAFQELFRDESALWHLRIEKSSVRSDMYQLLHDITLVNQSTRTMSICGPYFDIPLLPANEETRYVSTEDLDITSDFLLRKGQLKYDMPVI